MAAFVTGMGAAPRSQMRSVSGSAVCVRSDSVRAPGALTMRLGTVSGNSSLDKLGLDKFLSESNRAYTPRAQPGFSSEYEQIISATYKQLFGNAYIMDSERAEMAKQESMFRDGQLTLKDFCRALAKTEQYKKRFFDSRPLYGAIELNFKNILGRTPDGLEHYRAKSAVYDTKGYEAFVDAFFDDGEYDEVYDDYTVPFYRGYKTEANLSMAAFTHFFRMVRGSSTSDKANPNSMQKDIPLNYYGITKTPLAVIAPGAAGTAYTESFSGTGSWQSGRAGLNAARVALGVPATANGKSFRVEVTGYTQPGFGITAGTAVGKLYKANKLSRYPRSNKSYVVGFDELTPLYQRITKNGGTIASITPL
ncbi:Phycobilisome 31.8 kDa linker polypeptide, phycoerythrin-associated, rod [Porphyridium purpureum]|uniref:Phycobilisome 31.8 kDa linker polypeptide, phycoerythrin-associated, rod n=1 Tax=Porphyridium purpureum TaxID=35688 RepID=A0A5J4YM59_PORPP|nr:Chain X1, Phycobilisome 31.8 kDa linker polypeptide, phycoerythrin-associated, rod [Porphyridium purpureum]7EZX_X7 Chain X7, Phycobilisome 31.8 kDa linker polypeptide, phycoerythrin-associated, rod [Porphyridium purpureum]7EZX_X9 Chain X9, Phycobilisome 31.8 kDa linker polypeptide, phycoerythrin-associated, rod [Porphyridium purpureum]7EZX_XF Chain XF, Phycobilisome 31.8 kDa linker polypeptide, phycoerythrin-associated, rod [Porphyridium purpureum]7EZX_XI Chain XI, Phycobilisome 31.8 kDa lin|eukprot:POR7157..scf295_9